MDTTFETQHYIVHFEEGSVAAQEIEVIADVQERCYAFISQTLQHELNQKIHYYLCDSPEQVGKVYGDGEPCYGFARSSTKSIYAVYNQDIQCIGFHEDSHLISNDLHYFDSILFHEGLAMYFDRMWWGIDNQMCTIYYVKNGLKPELTQLVNNEHFYDFSDSLTYPIIGSFVLYLITTYGKEKFLTFWKQITDDVEKTFMAIYGQTLSQMDEEFTAYICLFDNHPAINQKLTQLLES